mgnify:FL=1
MQNPMIGAFNKLVKRLVGDKAASDVQAIQPAIDAIKSHESEMAVLSSDGLRERSVDLKRRILAHVEHLVTETEQLKAQVAINPAMAFEAKEAIYDQVDGLSLEMDAKLEEVLEEVLPEGFALLKETAKRFAAEGDIEVLSSQMDRDLAASRDFVRVEGDRAFWSRTWNAAGSEVEWNMVHYDVQLIGGVALHRGKVAEMQTGEGKTLVATLPMFLNALTGRGVHLVTVNDYLARRDSEWMGPIFQFHGLTVDCIDKHQPNSEARREAYKCDVVYGTNNEFGFDYLRDNMAMRTDQLVQRKHHYAIVDEVDSVLIDEARTPLIISGPTPKGDEHEFEQLRPKVVQLIQKQKQAVNGFITDAKKKLGDGSSDKETTRTGGLSLFRAYRGLPKTKSLIKFLSEEGIRQQMLKTEGFYLQDNKRMMPEADEELFFVIDEKQNQVELTELGIATLTANMEDDHFFTMPDVPGTLVEIDASADSDAVKQEKRESLFREQGVKSARLHTMNQLLKSYALFEKDIDYVVMDNKVKIVDEQTGRIMEGRRYSDGLHQAIEAKEGVRIEAATQTYATITLQNYFRMYHKLSGMTGTAETEAQELWDIYELDVMSIPTNRPIQRNDDDDMVFKTKREKFNAVIDDVVKMRDAGRPVLVGTTTVEVSELLSRMLDIRKIEHQVLNAKRHQAEAEVVAKAGQPGAVTIATNMAGRGTDIKLSEQVKAAGGLGIIGTERHDSRRVDRQLRGRSGRQGDPGSSQFYVSLEDDLMRLFQSERVSKMMDRLGHKDGEVIQHSMITKSIERAQRKVEENNFGIRKRLLEYDDVMNSQREVIYRRRRNALHGERLKFDISGMFYELSDALITEFLASKDYEGLRIRSLAELGVDPPFSSNDFGTGAPEAQSLHQTAEKHYHQRMASLATHATPVIQRVLEDDSNQFVNIAVPFTDGRRNMQVLTNIQEAVDSSGTTLVDELEKSVVLGVLDQLWKEHLRNMDDLRSNVQHARFEQKDPLLIYKFESYELFKHMVRKMNQDVASFLLKCQLPSQPDQVRRAPSARPTAAPRVQTSKQGVQNLNEQRISAARAGAQQAAPGGGQVGAMPPPPPPKVEPVRVEKKTLPNEPCPCGSGKKYKKCHGL